MRNNNVEIYKKYASDKHFPQIVRKIISVNTKSYNCDNIENLINMVTEKNELLRRVFNFYQFLSISAYLIFHRCIKSKTLSEEYDKYSTIKKEFHKEISNASIN